MSSSCIVPLKSSIPSTSALLLFHLSCCPLQSCAAPFRTSTSAHASAPLIASLCFAGCSALTCHIPSEVCQPASASAALPTGRTAAVPAFQRSADNYPRQQVSNPKQAEWQQGKYMLNSRGWCPQGPATALAEACSTCFGALCR